MAEQMKGFTPKHISTLRVRYGETDKMGVVYHSNYFRYFEVARSSYFRDLGYTYKRFEEEGFMLPLINCACDFEVPAQYDDLLEMHTHISHFKGARIQLNYEIYREGTLLVKGHTVHAFVDSALKPVNIKKANPLFYDLVFGQDKKKGTQGQMPMRTLGKTGLRVGLMGMGGIPLQRCDLEGAKGLLLACKEEGINLLDSARGYGASEALMGQALEELGIRNHFVIATKSPAKDKATMASEINTSLEQLRVSVIDIYQCHFIKDLDQYAQIIGPGGAYEALLEAKAAGKIKHIGMTAHNVDVLSHAIEDGRWETVQFPFNMVEVQGLEAFERAHERGIGILCMKPLAGGAIEDASLSLRYIAANPHITAAIPGMDAISQVVENAQAARDLSPLSEDEHQRIAQYQATMGQRFCRRCGYCGPCPVGIDIPVQFTLEGYLTRYDLKDWALGRFKGLPKTAKDCIKCGACEPRCPYDLPIRDMLVKVEETFSKY